MIPPMKLRIVICLVLLASCRNSQARSVKKVKGPAQRSVMPKHSSKLQTDNTLAGTTSCVQLGLRNMICVYNEGRLTDLPLYDDEQYSDEQFNIWPEFQQEQTYQPEAFVDLTRVDRDIHGAHNVGRSQLELDSSFSEDYLDVGDLSFTRKVDTNYLFTPREYRELTIFLKSPIRNHGVGRRIFSFSEPGLLNFLSNKLTGNINNEVAMRENSSVEEGSSDEDDSSDKRFGGKKNSESSEESDEEPKKVTKKVPKRMQKKRQKVKKGESSYVYIQGPSRVLSPDRRRLPHFLPKQFHWNKEDIHKLPFLWFHGPQGKFAGIYRKPF